MKKAFKIILLLGIILLMTYCKNDKLTREDESRNTNSIQTVNEIDQYVNQLRDRHKIPGISLAIIKDGKIVHKQHYGNANIEHNVPITDKSIFRVYSLTKPIVATGLFQLIEQ